MCGCAGCASHFIHVKSSLHVSSQRAACGTQLHRAILHSHLEAGWLVLDWHLASGAGLVLAANEVGDLLVLGLLKGRLVVLWALAHNLLLDEVDAW